MQRDPEYYEARAFHPTLGADGVAGRIVFTQFTFRFESESATVEIPCPQLTLRLLAGADEGVIFQSPGKPDWMFVVLGHEILEHRIFSGNIHLRGQLQAIFGRKAWRKAVTVTVAFFRRRPADRVGGFLGNRQIGPHLGQPDFTRDRQKPGRPRI